MNLHVHLWLCTLILFSGSLSGLSSESDKPELAIKYTNRAITFSGSLDSEETGQELAKSVKKVRPDLPIKNSGLRIDPAATIPPMADLKSLLAEIGLSSHEGGIAFYRDRVVVTGMTDSVVTVTAIQLRLEPILEGRTLVNRICIVSTADLPNLDLRLSSGETTGGLLDFDFYPTAEGAFVAPGIPLEKVYPTLLLMSSFEKFVDPAKLRDSTTVRALPLAIGSPQPDDPLEKEPSPPQLLRATPSGPINTYIELEPLLFSRDSFLLQASSRQSIARNGEVLVNPTYSGKKIIIRSLKWKGTSPAFVDYLAEKRAAEAKAHLTALGIPDSLIETDLVSSPSPVDTGEVKVMIEIPPILDPDEEDPEAAEQAVEPGDLVTPRETP